MKRLCALAAGVSLSVFLITAVNAAPAGTSKKPKPHQRIKNEQGIKNAKKAMQGKLERDKKIREVHKKGQEMRRKALSEK